jgi:hypothetical protein
MLAAPKSPPPKSPPDLPETILQDHAMTAADAMIDSWLLLLPRERKQVIDRSGNADELMFQAYMIIHV